MAAFIDTTTNSLNGFWGFGQHLPPSSRNSHEGQFNFTILECMVSPLTVWFLIVVACTMI